MMTQPKREVPTFIGASHNLTDRSRFRLGFEVQQNDEDGSWWWRPRNCFLRVHFHGPFPTAMAAWQDAVATACNPINQNRWRLT